MLCVCVSGIGRERTALFLGTPSSPWNKFRKLCHLIPQYSLPSLPATQGWSLGIPLCSSQGGGSGISFFHFSYWRYVIRMGGSFFPLFFPGVLTLEERASLFIPPSWGSWDRKGGINSLGPAFLESRDGKEWFSLNPPLLRCSPREADTGGCWLCSLCFFRSSSSPSGPRSRCCPRPP